MTASGHGCWHRGGEAKLSTVGCSLVSQPSVHWDRAPEEPRCWPRLDPRRRGRARGLSDLAIRNLFIIPTIMFLIVFNIFPLLYSLGYSFTDFRASSSAPARLRRPAELPRAAGRPDTSGTISRSPPSTCWCRSAARCWSASAWRCCSTATFPCKGLLTTLLLLPMMMSMAVVGLFWQLLYSPSWGIINYVLGLGDFAWLSDPDVALYAVAITDIWMWSPFVMLLSLAGLSAIPQHLYEAAAIDRASALVYLHAASRCRWWRRCC